MRASMLQKPHLYLVAPLSQRFERLRDDWLALFPAKHQAVPPCAHAPCAETLPPIGRRFPGVGLLVSTVGASPALRFSNLLISGQRARWLAGRRGPRADWVGSWPTQNHACGQRSQVVPTSPDSDRAHAQILCSLLPSHLFPVVLPCGTLGASASKDRSCRDQ